MKKKWFMQLVTLSLVLVACSSDSDSSNDTADTTSNIPAGGATIDGPHQRIEISNESSINGIFDPSLEYAPDGTGWMCYSAVYGERIPFGPYVETHLAKSLDKGASWEFVKTINQAADDSFETPDGNIISGNKNYEVSSLLYDPTDPGREWKLFNHRTFANVGSESLTLPQYTWITYRYTSAEQTPAGEWSSEEALMGSGITPLAPFNNLPRIRINSLHSDLNNYLVYSEPGTAMRGNTLFMTLTALTNTPQAIILLASDDHTQSWRYIATVLDNNDAAGLGFEGFDGTSIVRVGEKYYLFASPILNGQYSGTYIFEFSDISTASLIRDDQGVPTYHTFFPPDPLLWQSVGGNAGQSDYDQGNTSGGIIFPQIDVRKVPEIFQIFNTGYTL